MLLVSRNLSAPINYNSEAATSSMIAPLTEKLPHLQKAPSRSFKVSVPISWRGAGKVLRLSLLALGIGWEVSQVLKEQPFEVPIKDSSPAMDLKEIALNHIPNMLHICGRNSINLNSCLISVTENHFLASCPGFKNPLEFKSSTDFAKITSFVSGEFDCLNGNTITGTFQKDRLSQTYYLDGQATINGRWGYITGNFNTKNFDGYGIMTYPNGDTYEGDFKESQRGGKGTYIWVNGNKYEGSWVAGRRHGNGTLIKPNGEKYSGSFNNNKKEGYGVYTWPDGRKFEGNWKDRRRDRKKNFSLPKLVNHSRLEKLEALPKKNFSTPDKRKYVETVLRYGSTSGANLKYVDKFQSGRMYGKGSPTKDLLTTLVMGILFIKRALHK